MIQEILVTFKSCILFNPKALRYQSCPKSLVHCFGDFALPAIAKENIRAIPRRENILFAKFKTSE